jgi:hypothetical protein
MKTLSTETVEGTALALESVDDIEGGNSLAWKELALSVFDLSWMLTLGVLSVCDGITNDTLEEGLENTTGLFVDHYKLVST